MAIASTIAMTVPVIVELLKFYEEMKEVYGTDITPEQAAEIWMRTSTRYQAAVDSYRKERDAS